MGLIDQIMNLLGNANKPESMFSGYVGNGNTGIGLNPKGSGSPKDPRLIEPGSNYFNNVGNDAVERAKQGSILETPKLSSFSSQGQFGPFASGYKGAVNKGPRQTNATNAANAFDVESLFDSLNGGGDFDIPAPNAPNYLDADVMAREQADSYLQNQLAQIAAAQNNTQKSYNTNSKNIGTMYSTFSDDIEDDAAGLNTTYNDALKAVDASYAQGREGIQDQEAQSLARREALAKRLGTQEGTNELAKTITDAATEDITALTRNETANEAYLNNTKASTLSANTKTAQNAIRAGNAAKVELTNQLQNILGQLDVKRTEASGNAEEMFQRLFGGYTQQNAQMQQAYDQQLYGRQMDEARLQGDYFDRLFQVQQYGDARNDQAAQQQMAMAEMAMKSQGNQQGNEPGYIQTINYLATQVGPQKAQQLAQLAYNTVGSATSTSVNPGQLVADMKRKYPELARQFTDNELFLAASSSFGNEKTFSDQMTALQALLAQNQG